MVQGRAEAGPGLLLELCQAARTGQSPIFFYLSHSPGPRLVFNRVNGRRPPTTSPSIEVTQETYTLAHEENVRFVSEGSLETQGYGLGHWSSSPL